MKRIIVLLLMVFSLAASYAQESLKLNPVSGKAQFLRITTGDASVDFEGYDGDALTIEPIKTPESIPALAKGLSRLPLHNEPIKDSIGYKIIKNDSTIFDLWIRGTTYKHLRIRIPNRFAEMQIEAYSAMPQSVISVRNIKGSFNIAATAEILQVSHVAGPFKISGSVNKIILTDIQWQQLPGKGNPSPHLIGKYPPSYYISSHNDIDITLPAELKATITGGPREGRLYSDLNLTQHQDSVKNNLPTDPGNLGRYDLVKDIILNGGGIRIDLSSLFGNIYLRKAK